MRWRDVKHNKIKSNILTSTRHPQSSKDLYAGFWSRLLAFVTDVFMIGLPISLVVMILFGYDQMQSAGAMDVILKTEKATTHAPDPTASIVQMILYMSASVFFWRTSGQTPGKKMARISVVDATTLERASWFQLTLRFLGYFLSLITLFGFFVGLLRKDGRTLHDLISRTAVIKAH